MPVSPRMCDARRLGAAVLRPSCREIRCGFVARDVASRASRVAELGGGAGLEDTARPAAAHPCPDNEADQRICHREFTATLPGELVRPLPAPQQAVGFEVTKDRKERSVSRTSRERCRMRISLDQSQDASLRHA